MGKTAWLLALAALLLVPGCARKEAPIVFLGDSITHDYPVEAYYPGHPVVNRGVWGDTSADMAARLERDVVALAPAKVFLLAGVNDIGQGATAEQTAQGVEDLLAALAEGCPDARLYVVSVYPYDPAACAGWFEPEDGLQKILALNELLQGVAHRYGAVYIDAAGVLTDGDGALAAPYSRDGLHLTTAGYDAVTDGLRPYVED